MIYSVPPKPKYIKSAYSVNVGQTRWFEVIGSGFENLTNVYLSGHPLHDISTEHNPFEKFPAKTSNKYPPFFGVKLLHCEWSYDKNSTVRFLMPSATCPGLVDIIFENPAGYGKLTDNVKINTYSSSITFTPYQFPFISGISVLNSQYPIITTPSLSGFVLLDGDTLYLLQENGDRLELDFLLNNC